MAAQAQTTGITELDQLIGGLVSGDNVVLEADSGAPVSRFVSRFVQACNMEKLRVFYVSFNRSPQTVAGEFEQLTAPGLFTLIDCFSSGKGNGDAMFLKFFDEHPDDGREFVHFQDPTDPSKLQDLLIDHASKAPSTSRYVFDSLTGMLDLWRDDERVIRFFGHICPRLYDLSTIAYWILEKGAHSESFLAKVRHITQVVIEIALTQGARTLTVRKAANRPCADIGVPQRFEADNEKLTVVPETRDSRELGLLTRMSQAVDNALEPSAFFEQTMAALANEFSMVRGTLVLLDRATSKLKIEASHGLPPAARDRGEYAVGEGVTGSVVKTGIPEIVPDISRDPRFLDRTATRASDLAKPIAFICVPLKVDEEVVGALSVDRGYAVQAALEKDLRLLLIVGSIISQVIKINRLIQVEKDVILARDRTRLDDLRKQYRLDSVVGESEPIRKVLATAATAARSRASVLITGETGTGKELVANVVHYNSGRAAAPLVKVNCGALPETLLESELFGHVRGAFTGAFRDRKGRFEAARGGTVFLDEIAEMSPRLQVKLLRVLQERTFEPVGSTQTVTADVRVIAATSKNLKEEIEHGRFREDLYYRLDVIPIHIPPLRERREDVALLVHHFLNKYNRENGKKVERMSRKVLDMLIEYPWPGNVRELENCIEHAVVMSSGETLGEDLLRSELRDHRRTGILKRRRSPSSILTDIHAATETYCGDSVDLAHARETLLRTVEETIFKIAKDKGLSQRELAQRIGMSRMTLRKKMKECGMD